MLYRNSDECARAQVLANWLQTSTGWLQGLHSVLPLPPEKHTYLAHRLAQTPELELWLVAWGEHTTLEGTGQWMRVIQGTLFQETSEGIQRWDTGASGYQPTYRLHSVEPVYSIHIYATQT